MTRITDSALPAAVPHPASTSVDRPTCKAPAPAHSAGPAGVEERLQQAEQKIANLYRALGHSRDIGAAVGILMAQRRLPREEAFDLLREASMRTNTKLYELALEVVETGALPERR